MRGVWLAALALAACGKSTAATSPSSAPSLAVSPVATPATSVGQRPQGEAAPACPAAPKLADVHVEASVIGGFGAPVETLYVDGNLATLVVREADAPGQPIGSFQTCADEEAVRSMDDLTTRAAAAHEPRVRDGAMVRFTYQRGAHTVTAATAVPPSSPAGQALVAAMNALSTRARTSPRAAVTLEVVPLGETVNGKMAQMFVGKPTKFVVLVLNVGKVPIGVAFPEGGPWIETTAAPLGDGTWVQLGDKVGAQPEETLAPASTLASWELHLTATPTTKGLRAFLARFAGKIVLTGVPHLEGPFFTRLTSSVVTNRVQ